MFFVISLGGFAQDLNYVHYNTKDGLAGSTVYDMCQDKDGFIWFATENGLSRYDGTHFKNFTVNDGLPDNEVLKLFADSKGRLWIGTFAKELCYYFNGKIYNNENTTWLSKIHFGGAVLDICEDESGNLMVGDYQFVYEIFANNRFQQIVIPSIVKQQKSTKANPLQSIDGGFIINFEDSAFKVINGKLVFKHLVNRPRSDKFFLVRELANGKNVFIESPDTRIRETIVNFITIYVNTVNGVWSIDTVHDKLQKHFLVSKRVSRTIKDNEGNLWFSTMGEGVYKLPSEETHTIRFADAKHTDNTEVFSLDSTGNSIFSGLGFSKAALISGNQTVKILDYSDSTIRSINNLSTNRLYFIKSLSSGGIALGFDAYLVRLDKDGTTLFNNKIVAVKSVDEIDRDHMLVGTYSHAYILSVKNLSVTDTIWTGRCTKVLYSGNKYYVGTINGLFEVDQNKKYKYLGDLDASLKRRITDMKITPEGTLWIATNDKGLIAYKNGTIIAGIKDTDGLSSNICKSLYLDGSNLWVGTNKGLNRVDLKNFPSAGSIVKYSSSDGLPSDIVNALYVQDSIVWVGSPAGLTYFNENKVSHTSLCSLRLLSVSVSAKQKNVISNYNLSYKDNNIKIEFIAISFKSAGDIIYHYKLLGLDTAWQQTRETILEYPSLPPGDYKLQLYAINKFGVKSETRELSFSIGAPFWMKWWFFAVILIGAVVFTGLLVNQKNKVLRKRMQEKSNFEKQFADLEQQALQAQMNPHFIFNCLNSIQQYILTNDKEKANEYLTGFATLIRQTLDNSSKQSITVSEEIKYLSSYLEMEQMRFGDNFSYYIELSDAVIPDLIRMPALLLQPYVENALRHGIRYKQDGVGKVGICFSMENGILCCQVEDNGIGRKKAAAFKSRQHIEYQSKGMSLTEKRIELLNMAVEKKITVMIEDLENDHGNATGTKVTIRLPVR